MKCNAVEGKLEHLLWGSASEPFPWTAVQPVFHLLDLCVGELRDVATFRDVLSDEAVEVFVAAALPR